jgi:hypothetical protein
MLDSRYMLAGLDRLEVDVDFTNGSKYSRFGRPPSREGRDDDGCVAIIDRECVDGIRGLREVTEGWLMSNRA